MEEGVRIFISYAREDQDRVRDLYHRLVAAGFHPWLDREHILPGMKWEPIIKAALKRADFVLICLSATSIYKRGFLQKEIKQALEHAQENLEDDIWLIPARLDDCDVPDSLADIQWVDLFEDDGWEQLIRAIEFGLRRQKAVINTILAESLPFSSDLALHITGTSEGAIDRALPEDWQAAIERQASKPEREAVARAMQIAFDVRLLERCTDTAAISQVHHSLAASDLPGPASSMLRSFSRVSKDVDAALRQESAYNQRLALNVVEERLDSLLRELIRSSEPYVARFRPIVASWREIIARRIRELAKTVEERQEIDSPYVIGPPLAEFQEIFVGRTEVSARIEQLLLDRRRPPLLLYGQRRMGKTSLLFNLGRLLPSTLVPLFVDLQGAVVASNHSGLLYGIARSMTASAERHRGLILPALSRESLADDPFTRFQEWLDEVEKALDTNTALLALDEFETLFGALTDGRFSETDVLGMLRHLIQHRPRFKVLLAGSHTLDEFRRWASYLINVQVIKLGYLKEEETLQLIERPVPDFALRYEPDAARRVLNLTRGHPFLVQQLCAEIVALKNEQDPAIRRLARLSDVEAAIPEALGYGALFFSDIENNQVDSTGLAMLRFIAARGAGAIVNQSELTSQFGDEFETSLDLLLRRDLLEPVNGGYRFQVEMIRRWFDQPRYVDQARGSVKSWLRRAIP